MKKKKIKQIGAFDNTNEEITIFEWEAAERSYKRRGKDFWITAISILVLLSVILFMIKEYFLIVALMAVLFFYYTLSSVLPEKVKNKITNRAIYIGEARYEWILLTRFWFEKSLDSRLLSIETNLRFPGQISLVIDAADEAKIKEIMLKKMPLLENSPGFVDKLTAWVGKKIPLEDKK
jgi:hypothetical protein